MEDYPKFRGEIEKQLGQFVKEIPETMIGFNKLTNATNFDGALSKKMKELIAMGIAIGARCDGCIAFHSKALVDLKATRQEFLEMLQVAIHMGGGPSVAYAAKAMEAYEQTGGEKT